MHQIAAFSEPFYGPQVPPHPVSALVWEQFNDKLGHSCKLERVKRTRGRPRKHNLPPPLEGTLSVKISDVEGKEQSLTYEISRKLILDFKEYLEEGLAPRYALDEVCKLYDVSYVQAFNLCADEY